MTSTDNCPRCGSASYGGTSSHNRYECLTITWRDNGQIINESPQCRINQLTAALSEANTKLHLALNREHDLKRLLADIQLRRDNSSRDLQTHRDANGALVERVRSLESAYAECAEKLYRAEQREHDLRRRLDDMRGQRDQLTTELRQADDRTDRAEERVKRLESSADTLIDAIQSVQCWNGTYVGECIEQLESAKSKP